MDLVRHQMAELQHVNISDHDVLIEGVAGPAIVECRFPGLSYPRKALHLFRFSQVFSNFRLFNPIKYRGRDLETEGFGRHSEVSFEHLTDIHPTRHTERVQHDLNGSAIMQEWHIFFRHNLRNHTLVPVTACHLIADAQLTLAGDIDLHLLDNTRINVVATLDAIKR